MSLKDWFRSKCSCFWSKPDPEQNKLLKPSPDSIALIPNNTVLGIKNEVKLDKKNNKYNLNMAPKKFAVPNINAMKPQEKVDLYNFVSVILNKVLEKGGALTSEQKQVITENAATCENAFVTMQALRANGLQQAYGYLVQQIESPYKIKGETDTVECLLTKYINQIHMKEQSVDTAAVNSIRPVAAHVYN